MGNSVTMNLAWCSILALLVTRADLYPSVLNLEKPLLFQSSVRSLATRMERSDDHRLVALATSWPRNISYLITIGDLYFPINLAGNILDGKPLPPEKVSVIFMPKDDRSAFSICSIPSYSNEQVTAMNYSCFLKALAQGTSH